MMNQWSMGMATRMATAVAGSECLVGAIAGLLASVLAFGGSVFGGDRPMGGLHLPEISQQRRRREQSRFFWGVQLG